MAMGAGSSIMLGMYACHVCVGIGYSRSSLALITCSTTPRRRFDLNGSCAARDER
ncbi:hypothetical protein OG21DRAFT_1518199 [Imleria badia]|nr:hypothetical protein OG21DRAFT_1518199 [Imleria badia]